MQLITHNVFVVYTRYSNYGLTIIIIITKYVTIIFKSAPPQFPLESLFGLFLPTFMLLIYLYSISSHAYILR